MIHHQINLVLNDTSPMLPVENILDISIIVFVLIAIAFTMIAWDRQGPSGPLFAAIGMMFWFFTGLYWMWEKAGTEAVHFFYAFEMLALVCLLMVIYKAMTIHRLSGKKGAWR